MQRLMWIVLPLILVGTAFSQTHSKSPAKPKQQSKKTDRDGDGVSDDNDSCPNLKGTKSNNGCPEANTMILASISIGSQVWMQQNLNVDRFRNGELIPEAKTDVEWKRFGEQRKPCWCYFDNDPGNGKVYGKLYNWYAVNDSRGLAPMGWHIPSDLEWIILTDYLGGNDVAGGKLKSSERWKIPNEGASNGDGFRALPGGYRGSYGTFYDIGDQGNWWSSTEDSTTYAWDRSLGYFHVNVIRSKFSKRAGFSVRCVKD